MVEIRRLTPKDVEIYQALRLEALSRHPDAFGSSYEDAAAEDSHTVTRILERNTIFGAFDSSTLIGKAGFFIRRQAKLSHKGVLFGMCVKEAARRRGIGSRLVGAVLEHARGRVETVQLTVATSNAAAVAFYESHGFVRYGAEPRALKLGETYIDEALMETPLRLDD
jgi:ribosomal protein S18 acetylase RimI-like enzyme